MSFADVNQAERIRRAKKPEDARSMSFKLAKFNQGKWDATSYNVSVSLY